MFHRYQYGIIVTAYLPLKLYEHIETTMLRAFDLPVQFFFATTAFSHWKVSSSPRTDSTPPCHSDELFAAFPATALLPFCRMRYDGDESIRTDSHVIDNGMLDIQDGFEYLLGEHTFPFCTAFFSRKIVQE